MRTAASLGAVVGPVRVELTGEEFRWLADWVGDFTVWADLPAELVELVSWRRCGRPHAEPDGGRDHPRPCGPYRESP